jgi:protein O-GlcNAc transferase
VAWGDYVDTRGLAALDILLGDGIHTPPDEDLFYVERVVRFAPDYICYAPPAYAPPVAPAPCLAKGCVTFATFSEPTKIGETAIATWAAVLAAIPDSRFLFNGRLFAKKELQQRLMAAFLAHGIGSDRLSFRHGGSHEAFLGQYAEADVILDTAPYAGGLTTCEALLQGVPVLTIPGARFCGRHAAAHLINGGYAEGVASSTADMTARAKALAADFQALSDMRPRLRERFLRSTVCDVARFAHAFYGTLGAEWAALCARNKTTRLR